MRKGVGQMERLTIKKDDGRYYINQLSIDNSYSEGINCLYGKPIDKLAEFEDFMEANKFENINELQNALNGKFEGFFDEKHKIWIKTVEDSTKCKKENQTLKGNWAKLREWVWDKEPLFKGANAIFKKSEVLEKMRELEGGDGRNKQ